MKIGIITCWSSSDNYGQLLQCWALQRYLISEGHEPYLIRYKKPAFNPHKGIIRNNVVYNTLRKLKHLVTDRKELKLQKYYDAKNVQRNFDGFRQSYIALSERVYTSLADLQEHAPEADAYITGSDQVWFDLLSDKNNEAMFLNFGRPDTKRFAYAASYGMKEYPEELRTQLKANLSRFDAISNREQDGVAICQREGFLSVKVLDPTLLLNAEMYREIAAPRKHAEPYVFFYFLNVRNEDELYAKTLRDYCQSQGLQLVCTTASGYYPCREIVQGATYDYATIPEWISNIDHAELVVTTSFHGVVFCLALHRPFIYIPLKGQYSKANNRIYDLLKTLDLMQCALQSEADFTAALHTEFQWSEIDARLSSMREVSVDFLNQLNK